MRSLRLGSLLLLCTFAARAEDDARPDTDGFLVELRALAGTGAMLSDSFGESSLYVGVGATAGYRYARFEAGVEGHTGANGGCILCTAPHSSVASLAGFAGVSLLAKGVLSVEIRGKIGAHFYSAVESGVGRTQPDATTLTFIGFEPRLSFRFGGERVGFLLGLGIFADIDGG